MCKALAQRLSIRLLNRFKRSIFIEVNSHSLFSKWFSEVKIYKVYKLKKKKHFFLEWKINWKIIF